MTINHKKVVIYNFHKHHILENNRADSISEVSDRLIGLHSARLITPFTSLIPRINKFNTNDLHNEIIKKSNLIKLRCMRKTLHTVTMKTAPIVHRATLKLRLSDCYYYYRKNNNTEAEIKKAKHQILNMLELEGASSPGIIEKLKLKFEIAFIRVILKQLWEEGTVCSLNKSIHWEKENRVYDLTSRIYPNLSLDSIDTDKAQEALILNHIDSFGPVTEKDICWWSGLSTGIVRKALVKYDEKIIKVKVKGFEPIFYMTLTDHENYDQFRCSDESWISLLAYEDPSLKGYYDSRFRYVDSRNYSSLFNTIGEARASIIKNGLVVGIWSWNKKKQNIEYSLFNTLKKDDTKKLELAIDITRSCLLNKI